MNKKEIAKILKEISDVMIIAGENEFRARAYMSAARAVETAESIEEVLEGKVKGIGKSIKGVVKEIVETGKSSLLEELKGRVPEGVIELLNLKGLGAKRIYMIYKKLGVKSIGELEYACKENRITLLKGFGKKVQDNILRAIREYRKNLSLFTISEAEEIEKMVRERAKKLKVSPVVITGDLRRRCEVYSKVEFITFNRFSEKVKEITKDFKGKVVFHFADSREELIKVLFETTGSEEFVKDFKTFPASKEVEIFLKNRRDYVIPEQREKESVYEKNCVKVSDIRGVFHVHTTYSDGTLNIEQIASLLKDRGYDYVVICDHSKSAFYAGGLSEDDIKRQHEEIERLNEKFFPFKIVKGIECDILKDGSLDYPEKILEKFEVVIASVHSSFSMSEKQMTERILKAIKNPYTKILGHPTGRLLTIREGYKVDMEKVIATLGELGKAVEINCQPYRLDIDWRWASFAKKYKVKFAISVDAHNIEDFEYIRYGVSIARKAGLKKEDILNCFNWA